MLAGGSRAEDNDGGYVKLHSAEVYSPVSNTFCSLPDLQINGEFFDAWIAEGNLLCDDLIKNKCYRFLMDTGVWSKTNHKLTNDTGALTSAKINNEVILFGGRQVDKLFKTTILKPDGTVENGFNIELG